MIPLNESTPKYLKISIMMASEAVPENGRKSIMAHKEGSIFNIEEAKILAIKSSNPLIRKRLIANIIDNILPKTSLKSKKPSLTPFRKAL